MSIVTALGDGHTDLHEGPLFQQAHPYLTQVLPFTFKIIGERVYVSESFTTEQVPAFAELVAVEGIKVQEVLDQLYRLTPADGDRLDFKKAYNEKILQRSIPQLIGVKDKYTLSFRNEDGSSFTTTVDGVDQGQIKPRAEKLLTTEINKAGNYAILKLNTFQYNWLARQGIDFHKEIKSFFKKLKSSKIENLIIDLRENYGGDNILAVTLYSYLTTGEFKAMGPSRTKLMGVVSVSPYSNYPEGNYPFLRTHQVDTLGDGYYSLKDGIDSKPSFDSDYIFKGPNAKPENIAGAKFSGKVYVLTSGLTFSAAANFATLLRRDERAFFIGRETGGNAGNFCGGGFFKVTLPNAKFTLHIPYMNRRAHGTASDNRGVIPDLGTKMVPADLANDSNVELTAAIKLIRADKNR